MANHYDLITDQPNQTAVDFLAQKTGVSKGKIKDAMNKGACWWVLKGKQQRLRRATKVLEKGSRVQFYYDEAILSRKPALPTLLEDFGDFSVWFKPHGVLAQGSQWGDHCSLLRMVEIATNRTVFLIHRLDADASGLMVIAHTQQAAAKLSGLFQGRDIYKEYRARIVGKLAQSPLTISTPIEDKDARSTVELLNYDDATHSSLVKVVIETGRKHQIRRHLASIDHPILNDRLYGKSGSEPLQLSAHRIRFKVPGAAQEIEICLADYQLEMA